jgi:uncharacterized protein
MPTVSDRNLAAVQRFFAAYQSHDLDSIAAVLAADVAWTIPGHHPLSGTKHGIPEVVAFFDQLATVGFLADPLFLGADDDYVVDIHRGWTTAGTGQVDTTWALVWHFGEDGLVDRVVNLSGDQHQMDAFIWDNFELRPLPDRLVSGATP